MSPPLFVHSEAIRMMQYHPDKRTLDITFRSGEHYEYFDVAPDLYAHFVAADSKGAFFQSHIRDAYRFRRKTRVPRLRDR